MEQLTGKAVSPGYATGTAFVYQQPSGDQVPRYEIRDRDVEDEHRRLRVAMERSFHELKQLEQRVLIELGEAQSEIFAAHLGLLQDHKFVNNIKARVQRELVNVEHALQMEVADLCQILASVENEYIRERAQDIRDVGLRVMRQLVAQDAGRYVDLPPASVIVAHELLPSQTLDLDREHVAGIITEEGGENSHAAILARALGIPAVTGISTATSLIPRDAHVLIDGEKGLVSVAPSDAALSAFSALKSHYEDHMSAALTAESLDCVTQDGTRVSLLANINRPHESGLVTAHRLDGVGLFRTEFMFLESPEPPNFDRQVTSYRQIVESLDNYPVVIRTLDLGGDKLPAFVTRHHETNPNLGRRGLRFSLAERSLFETQIRAIITASQGCQHTRILLPMVLGGDDLRDATELIHRLSSELGNANSVKIGAMIETPSALFALDEICAIADFVCVGTNDLTQFMLAADRNDCELADDYSSLHPSVLRAIAKVVEAANSKRREVCVCGEAASYPKTACLLVGLGVRQLSMSPVRAARVRYLLRETRISELQALAHRAVSSTSTAAVRSLLEDLPSPGRARPDESGVS